MDEHRTGGEEEQKEEMDWPKETWTPGSYCFHIRHSPAKKAADEGKPTSHTLLLTCLMDACLSLL